MKNFYVITGASSGIGWALCHHLAKQNKDIIAIARNRERLSALKSAYPHLIVTIQADLASSTDRDDTMGKISNLGKILGLVNNAATNEPISLLQNLSCHEWHQQAAINIDAPVFLTQCLLPLFLKGGRIINITTGTTHFIASGAATYAMTKAAINVFSKYLSEELRSKQILVTAAHPGIVRTNLIENIARNKNTELGIFKAQQHFQKKGQYLDVNLSAKFLSWLLLQAEDSLYTGDIIGIYNQKYQPLWHNEMIPSPYPDHIAPP